jgi:hypothetical protein
MYVSVCIEEARNKAKTTPKKATWILIKKALNEIKIASQKNNKYIHLRNSERVCIAW